LTLANSANSARLISSIYSQKARPQKASDPVHLGSLFEVLNIPPLADNTRFDNPDEARSRVKNFLRYGFEGVEVTLSGAGLTKACS